MKTKKEKNIFTDLSKSVYIIARGRKIGKDQNSILQWNTLGTGFLVGVNKFVTCCHVIDDPSKGDNMRHQDGDMYYLINRDDNFKIHWHIFKDAKLNEDIFLYPEKDFAFMKLRDDFYGPKEKPFKEKDVFIHISKDFHNIGKEIGVLGYPLSALIFENQDLYKPVIGNILLRANRGIINTRFQTTEKLHHYEFTLSFYPGNSGGPIFDIQTGELVSIVRGFRTISIDILENELNEEQLKRLKNYKEKSYITQNNAMYSFGIATNSLLDIFKEHRIIF